MPNNCPVVALFIDDHPRGIVPFRAQDLSFPKLHILSARLEEIVIYLERGQVTVDF